MVDKNDVRVALIVGGVQVMSGDSLSMRVVFGNFHGRNFAVRNYPVEISPAVAHKEWLDMMSAELGVKLNLRAPVKLLDDEGVLVAFCCTGEGLPRPDPEIGGKHMVRVWPMGSDPIWYEMVCTNKKEATAVSRELFYFSPLGVGNDTFPVTREELLERVMPV